MPSYLLLSRSITHAQRMSAILSRAGIRAPYQRTPMSLSRRGCGYAVYLDARRYTEGLQLLKEGGLRPVSVFLDRGGGKYSEITGF